MKLEYMIGIVLMAGIAVVFFLMGRITGGDSKKRARQLGYDEGYRHGQKDGRAQMMQDAALAPFRERPESNRRALPRPDSAGTVRSHRAVVRGDHRLPHNQDERPRTNSVVKPPRTKLIRPSELEDNGSE